MIGNVKTTVRDRGFGFLTSPDGESWFFHMTDCPSTEAFYALAEGDEVSFQPVEPAPPKGPRASQVQPVATTAPEPAA